MLVINGFDGKPGTPIKVKINSIDEKKDMSTFAGVLKRFDEDGGGVDKNWTASELLAGATATLGDAHGYDVIILPVSGPGKNPTMNVTMDATAVGFTETVDQSVGDNVPFGWRIFIQ
jgi:hypothetical protein